MPEDRYRGRIQPSACEIVAFALLITSGVWGLEEACAQGPLAPSLAEGTRHPVRSAAPARSGSIWGRFVRAWGNHAAPVIGGDVGPPHPRPPEAMTMPSAPIVPPPAGATTVPIPVDRMNIASSPTVPPLSRMAPADPDVPRAVMRLEDFEQMALEHNPTLAQSAGVVGVSRGRAWQAGLWPNPLLGYQADQVGAKEGSPQPALGSHQALYFQQEIPSARRQQISRRKYEWEAESARWYAAAQELRVLNSVRSSFFEALGAQQLVITRGELLKIADAALRTTEEMVNDGQANLPDLLQARVQQQQNRVALVVAENEYRRAWAFLIAEAGVRALPPTRLEGPLDADTPDLDFDATLRYVLENSPEIQAAVAEIRRDEVVVHRERVQPIPNLFVQGSIGPNFIDGGMTSSVELAGNIPVWNKNQGTIFQASSHLRQAQANLLRVQLSLEKRLATEMARYNGSLALVRTYRDESLPAAKKAYDLLVESYRRRRAAWPQVLVAQRLWFDLQVQYVMGLIELRRAEVAIKGLLLVGGLDLPQVPEPLGNINVSPNPR
jgi:outer membrane protein, heavy metal efflux system